MQAAEDESIWMIRRLPLDFDLALDIDNDAVAAAWAVQVAAALERKLRAENDPDVIRFDSRAAQIARYFVETTAGSAGGKWYFAPFEGLAQLPPSAAIRTLVCEDARESRRALFRLSSRELPAVIGQLSEADARIVLDRVSAIGAASGPAIDLLISTFQTASPRSVKESFCALLVFLEAARRQDDLGPAAASASRALARLHRLTRELPPGRARSLIEHLSQGAMIRILREFGTADAEVLTPLAGSPVDALASIALAPPSSTKDTADRRYTPFGGVFFLLPLLDELPLANFFKDTNLTRLWILLKCLGQPRAYPAFLDPLLRDLLGVDPDLPAAAFARWQRQIPCDAFERFRRDLENGDYSRDNRSCDQVGDREYLVLPRALCGSKPRDKAMSEAARLVLRNFAWRLPGFATASFRHLFDNFLDAPASIEDQPQRRVVRVGRSPLALILNLSGVSRASYVCPWLDERPFELFPEA
jgi:hypothetical protein